MKNFAKRLNLSSSNSYCIESLLLNLSHSIWKSNLFHNLFFSSTASKKYLDDIEIDTDGNVIKKEDETTPRARCRTLRQELKAINSAADEEEQNRCKNILKKRDIFEDFSQR